MAMRYLNAGRPLGDHTKDDWWFLLTEFVVRTPLDDSLKAVLLEAVRRNKHLHFNKITFRGETEDIQRELDEFLKHCAA